MELNGNSESARLTGGRSSDETEQATVPVVPDASCYLYNHGGRFVTGPRVVDATTVAAEAMTLADFSAYRKQNVDHTATETLVEAVRDVILRANHNGALLAVGISPAILSDDWILRATEFVEILNKTKTKENDDKNNEPIKELKFGIAEKLMNHFSDRWLNIEVIDDSGTVLFELPLVLITGKKDDLAAPILNKVMKEIRGVLVDSFPNHKVWPLPNAQELFRACAEKYHPVRNDAAGKELCDALVQLQELRKRGASREEIVVGMKRMRDARRNGRKKSSATSQMELSRNSEILTKQQGDKIEAEADEENQALLPVASVVKPSDLQKRGMLVGGKSLIRKPLKYRRTRPYSFYVKVMLLIAAVYFIYALMRAPKMVRVG